MGLESVELVLGYEDAFRIEIPDPVAAQLLTPRDVIDHVLPRLTLTERAPCLHASAFYLVRRGFGEHLHVPRRRIRLDTALSEIVPDVDRRFTWLGLGSVLGVKLKGELGRRPWPELSRSWGVHAMLLVAVAATCVALLLVLPRVEITGSGAFWLAIVGTIGALYVGAVLTRPFKTNFPARLATVRQLVEHLTAAVPHAGKAGRHGWTSEQVEWVVRRVTMDVLGVTTFSLDDQFVRDLGVS